MEQDEFLRKLATALDRARVRYLVTGGIAVVVWGRPRFTADIDVVVELTPENLNALAQELKKIAGDIYLDVQMMQRALRTKGEFNLIHSDSGLKVDFWMLRDDDPFDRERMRRRIRRKVAATGIYFSSPEDLVLIKLRWHKESGSEQQLRDIESILHVQEKLDTAYLRKWARRHSTSRMLTSLLAKSHHG